MLAALLLSLLTALPASAEPGCSLRKIDTFRRLTEVGKVNARGEVLRYNRFQQLVVTGRIDSRSVLAFDSFNRLVEIAQVSATEASAPDQFGNYSVVARLGQGGLVYKPNGFGQFTEVARITLLGEIYELNPTFHRLEKTGDMLGACSARERFAALLFFWQD